MGVDSYMYADGSDVLINRLGIKDKEVLQDFEFRSARGRAQAALAYADNVGVLDEQVRRGIHKRLFGDVYDWAGKFRMVDIAKGASSFAPWIALNGWADKNVLPAFRAAADAAGDDDTAFSLAVARLWGELNHLHPFREGNGRATQVFVVAMMRRYGRSLDFSRVSRDGETGAAQGYDVEGPGLYTELVSQAMVPGRTGDPMRIFWPAKKVEKERAR